MFDLEQAITAWRRQLRAAGLEAPAVLDELESHLREATAEQMQAGSTAAEAFALAVQRMGKVDVLRAEFARARVPDRATIRKWTGIAYIAELAAYTALSFRLLLKFTPTHNELWLGIAGLAMTLLAAYGGWHLVPRLMRLIPSKAIRWSGAIFGTLLASIGWMAFFARFILPDLDLTPGQFAVAVLWALLPMVTAPTLILGIDPPERERAG